MAELYDDPDSYVTALHELRRCPDCLLGVIRMLAEHAAGDHTAMLLLAKLLTDEQVTWVADHQDDPTARRASAENIASLMNLLMGLEAACREAGLA